MAYNVSGWGTVTANQTGYQVSYIINGGEDRGAQFAQAKPEGAPIDGTQNGSLTSYNHDIYLDVATQHIIYSFFCKQHFKSRPEFYVMWWRFDLIAHRESKQNG